MHNDRILYSYIIYDCGGLRVEKVGVSKHFVKCNGIFSAGWGWNVVLEDATGASRG